MQYLEHHSVPKLLSVLLLQRILTPLGQLGSFLYASLFLRAKDGHCILDLEDLRPSAPVQDYELLQQSQNYVIGYAIAQIPELSHDRRPLAPSTEESYLRFATTNA